MLEIKNLVYLGDSGDKEGGRKRPIIDDVSFIFETGKFYAITGPNGSGKTTLAKLIMGIYRPDSGRIFLDGEDVTDLSVPERAKKGIAYSFQHPARFKGITLRDLISIAANTDDEIKIREIMTRVGICPLDFLDKFVDSKLSGGEIKKVELATTIAQNPSLAIYDEPDTGIDLWTIKPMVELLKKEQLERKTTTIVVSHNRRFLEVADVVLIVREGKIANVGTFQNVLPFLTELSTCSQYDLCEGEYDARCYR